MRVHQPPIWSGGWWGGSRYYKLKQTGVNWEGEKRSGHQLCGDRQRHQQHVLWDSEACRPSLKPRPVVAPTASAAGMRLPEETHKKCQYTLISSRGYVIVQYQFILWQTGEKTDLKDLTGSDKTNFVSLISVSEHLTDPGCWVFLVHSY